MGRIREFFRLSCELREEVNPELLQQAVDLTMKDYPYFRSVLRKGLFWYYLDSRDLPLQVEEEKLPACSPLYFPGKEKPAPARFVLPQKNQPGNLSRTGGRSRGFPFFP
jgi:hypothetical protein